MFVLVETLKKELEEKSEFFYTVNLGRNREWGPMQSNQAAILKRNWKK